MNINGDATAIYSCFGDCGFEPQLQCVYCGFHEYIYVTPHASFTEQTREARFAMLLKKSSVHFCNSIQILLVEPKEIDLF
jgi:hypothetical protein